MLIVALFTVVKVQKQPKCPSTGEWIKKMGCICVYINTMEMLISPKKNDIFLFVGRWMDLKSIMLREISKRKTNTM